jgi:hypothetical protein
LPTFLLAAVVLSLAACAGTKVQNVQQTAAEATGLPPRTIAIIVENDAPLPVKEKDQAKQLEDVPTVLAALQEGLAKKLSERGLTVVPPGQPADLTLHCAIEEIRRGSQALRMTVGLGAGKAVLRVNVALVASAMGMNSALLTFDTQSTTGSMPGAAIGPASNGEAIAGKALGIVGGLRAGLAKETDQTVGKIDDQLQIYFAAQHWPYTKSV